MSDDFGFIGGVPETEYAKKGFVEMPAGDYDEVLEILSAESATTQDGQGKNIKIAVRICNKPWANRRAWKRFFVQSSDPNKQKGASIGAADFTKLLQAAGFVVQKDPSEEQKKAMMIGLAERFDQASFRLDMLVGKFFRGRVRVPEPNADGKVYPEVIRFFAIDPDDYADIISKVEPKKEKKDDAGGEQPPF